MMQHCVVYNVGFKTDQCAKFRRNISKIPACVLTTKLEDRYVDRRTGALKSIYKMIDDRSLIDQYNGK